MNAVNQAAPAAEHSVFKPNSEAIWASFEKNINRIAEVQAQLLEARLALVECRSHAREGNLTRIVTVVDGVLEPVFRFYKDSEGTK